VAKYVFSAERNCSHGNAVEAGMAMGSPAMIAPGLLSASLYGTYSNEMNGVDIFLKTIRMDSD
jgi:hypothetical protein